MSIKRHQAGKLFSAAVEHGGLVYVAGQVADDLTQGVRGQTEQVLKKIDAILAAAGTSKSKIDRKSTRLNSSHSQISYAVFCLKKKKTSNHKLLEQDRATKMSVPIDAT